MICICVNFVAKYVDKQDPESNAIVVFVERKQPLQTIPNLTEPYLLLSDISSALLTFNDSLAFLTVICFHFLNKKLKCHLCHSFDNTWLRYPLAQSLLDYQLQFGWINLLDVRQECNPIRPFDSSSEILFVCLFSPLFCFFFSHLVLIFTVECLVDLEKSVAGCFLQPFPLSFTPPQTTVLMFFEK